MPTQEVETRPMKTMHVVPMTTSRDRKGSAIEGKDSAGREHPEAKLLGASLRLYRISAGKSRREVAAATGYSETYIKKIERGERTPSREALEGFCAALGVQPDDIRRICKPGNRKQRELRSLVFKLDQLLEELGASTLKSMLEEGR